MRRATLGLVAGATALLAGCSSTSSNKASSPSSASSPPSSAASATPSTAAPTTAAPTSAAPAAGDASLCAKLLPILTNGSRDLSGSATDPKAVLAKVTQIANSLDATVRAGASAQLKSATNKLSNDYRAIVASASTGKVPDTRAVTTDAANLGKACGA